MVFRAVGWAAGQGRSLDEVWTLASRANDRTRTLGVAFSGCTLPGAQAPLFTVPAGRMAIGMGIHGEPGIQECPLPTAAELARLLVDRLLAERPHHEGEHDLSRVAVILNGLARSKPKSSTSPTKASTMSWPPPASPSSPPRWANSRPASRWPGSR